MAAVIKVSELSHEQQDAIRLALGDIDMPEDATVTGVLLMTRDTEFAKGLLPRERVRVER